MTTSYTGPPVAIPDGLGAESPGAAVTATLAVAQTGQVGKVVFRFDGTTCTNTAGATTVGLDHTFVGDLVIDLIDPTGTTVRIINRITNGGGGNSGNNFCQTVLDDSSAGASIETALAASAPFTGSWKPNSPLAAFNGDTISGTWTLRVQDFFVGDTGNIRAWSLNIVPVTCAAPPAPTAANDTYSLPANTPFVVPAPGVLSNDVSPSGATLAATQVTGPAHSSSFTLNADGSFSYTPAPGYAGPDSFTYTAGDGTAISTTATVNLTVTGTAPVAQADTYTISANTTLTVDAAHGVLANDTLGTPAATITAHTNPAHGALTLNADGSLTYVPTTGYIGPDGFTYTLTNSGGPSTGNVNLTVTAIAPSATNDSYATPANTPLIVTAPGVLNNDTGVPPPTAINATTPAHGSVTLNTDGSFTYTPTTGYAGPDAFTYQATNGGGTSAPATVSITVMAIAPVAHVDAYTATAGIPLTVGAPGVLANDSGIPAPTATKASDPAHGTLTLNTDGSFTYTAVATFAGTDTFTYTATNSGGTSAAATVTVTVAAAPLTSIAVTPAGATLKVGQAQQYNATGTYANGTTADLTSQVTWSSDTAAVASVDASGKVAGQSPGSAHITATQGSISGQASVTVSGSTPVGIAPVAAPAVRPGSANTPTGSGSTPAPAPTGR